MLHFAQAAIALITAGASVLIVGGLVRESLHDDRWRARQIADAHDRPETSLVNPTQPAASDLVPFPHPRGENARHSERGRTRGGNESDVSRSGRKKPRPSRKRDRAEQHPQSNSQTLTVNTEDV